jgi:hypothetical protein
MDVAQKNCGHRIKDVTQIIGSSDFLQAFIVLPLFVKIFNRPVKILCKFSSKLLVLHF